MKNIFFTFVTTISAALFFLSGHLSAQLPIDEIELEANNASTPDTDVIAKNGFGLKNGSFSTKQNKVIAAGDPIPLDIGRYSREIHPYNDPILGSGIIVKEKGSYLVSFGVTKQNSSFFIVALTVDGMQTGINLDLASMAEHAMLGITTIIDICVLHDECCSSRRGSLVQLVNNSTSPFQLGNNSEDSLTAFMTLVRIGDCRDCD